MKGDMSGIFNKEYLKEKDLVPTASKLDHFIVRNDQLIVERKKQ